MILSGPSGCGKTTAVTCLASAMHPTEFIELNASDDRGIDAIRTKVKSLAQSRCPVGTSYRLMLLDEADSMTPLAQHALRGIIEKYSNKIKFALSCNDLDKIVEQLQSRCMLLRFCKLSDNEVFERLQHICHTENIHFTVKGLRTIANSGAGDLRCATNVLESYVKCHGNVIDRLANEFCKKPETQAVDKLLHSVLKKDMNCIPAAHHLINSGYASADLLAIVLESVQQMHLNVQVKVRLLDIIMKYKIRQVDGVNSDLQMCAMFAEMCS